MRSDDPAAGAEAGAGAVGAAAGGAVVMPGVDTAGAEGFAAGAFSHMPAAGSGKRPDDTSASASENTPPHEDDPAKAQDSQSPLVSRTKLSQH